jgi:thiol-disulfide isomerase/thioredoxin
MKIITISSFKDWTNYKNENTELNKFIFFVSANWCKPCAALKPELLDFLNSIIDDNITVIQLNYDIYIDDPQFENIMIIKKIPHFSFFINDKLINSIETSKFNEISLVIKQFIENNNINDGFNNIDTISKNNFELLDEF